MKIKLKSPASRYDAVIRPNRRRTGREIGIPGFPQRGGATAASGIMRRGLFKLTKIKKIGFTGPVTYRLDSSRYSSVAPTLFCERL